MDVLFQLLLPELPAIEGLERNQRIFNWGGVDYPQEPAIYRWGEHVELVPSELQPFIPRFLPAGYIDKSWIFLDVKGDGLDLWESEVNGREVDWFGYRLDDLLKLILEQQGKWLVIFELNYDQIDNTYTLNADECIQKLESNLRLNYQREGFIATKRAA
jgi:hypothetical protein